MYLLEFRTFSDYLKPPFSVNILVSSHYLHATLNRKAAQERTEENLEFGGNIAAMLNSYVILVKYIAEIIILELWTK